MKQYTEKKVGKWVFLSLALAAHLTLTGILALTWYLIEPRLGQLYAPLPGILGWIAVIFVGLVTVESVLVTISALTERNFMFPKGEKQMVISLLFPILMIVGRLVGLSNETIRKSFISFNNALVKAVRADIRADRILILLPQCLQNTECPHRITIDVNNCVQCGRCTIGDIKKLAERYHAALAVATGGTLARKVVRETRPTVIVAVACDRDLTSGIQYTQKIPTLGILNRRPFGPCMNTSIDLAELEKALRFVTEGKDVPAPENMISIPRPGSAPAPHVTRKKSSVPENIHV